MRMKKSMPVEGGTPFNLERLYYLSVHTLDSKDGVKYGKNRLNRELLDMWIDKRFSFASLSFQETEPTLSEAATCNTFNLV